ncbi:ribosome biogenesis GTPase Der [bacterium]|nr:ribosome biogenesis GTPase Der [bacterium]MBU1674351.1 ribosome biogenesis GTPase Der [bacterium]
MSTRTVVIVGRPNVGKSTLFNRIIGQRRSVVHETPGVTRDRIAELTDWAGHAFLLLDTGGIVPFGDEVSRFDALVTEVAHDAIEEADVVLFMVDGSGGLSSWDDAIAQHLRRSGKPVVLCVNKVEKEHQRLSAAEFYSLGLGEPHVISALHGHGIGDLLDRVAADFPKQTVEAPCDSRVAILGRPNVGKSSLLNLLTGRQDALVSEIAGTTRDAIHTDLRWHGRTLRLIDTAGLRRKSRVQEAVEAFSNMRTFLALEQCDVAVLMVDASDGTVSQDAKIAGLIHDSGKGVVVAFNKWDLVEKDHNTHLGVWETFCREVPFLTYAPWFTLSAHTHQRSGRVLETVWAVHEARLRRVETSVLNAYLEGVIHKQPPRFHGGGTGKVYYATQIDTAPPVFMLSVNNPQWFDRSFVRFINNKIRARFGFEGSRIFVKLKKH